MALKPLFSDIAGAIRAKNGSTVQTSANAFPNAILALPKAFTGTPSKTYAGAAGLRELFSDTADAIRAMDGSTADIVAANIPARIRAIQLLRSIAVTTPPKKTSYKPGDTFDPSGMVVTASYPNGVTKTVTGYTYSPAGPLSLSDTAITVSYTEDGKTVSTTQAISVQNVQVPVPAQSGTLTYTGYALTPVWSGYDSTKMTIGGTTSATNAGSYTAAFTPKLGYCWPDNTTGVKNVTWSIGKAAGSLSVSPTSVTLDKSNLTRTSSVTRAGDGAITAVSSNTSVATVSVSGKTVTIHSVNNTAGTATITVKVAEGTNHTAPANVTISVTAKFVSIYGAEWDGSSTTKWTRTDAAAGFTDPVPYTAGKTAAQCSSPFDNLQPWAGMTKSNRTGGVMVAIPKFWYKLTQNGSGMKAQIADKATAGFSVSPAHMNRGDGKGERDVVYIGRYHCASDYKSKTGVAPKASITRSAARSGIHALGSNIWQNDFAMRFTLWLLYIVEFADWNTQKTIGKGCGNSSGTENMGYTDSMPYHTGTTQSSRDTYGVGTQYRNIEGLWDNVYDWCDGCYNNSNGLNVILNPNSFSDSSGGTCIGKPVDGWPAGFTVSNAGGFPAFYPSKSGGSETTYSCDYWYFVTSYPCVFVGGSYNQYGHYGLFYVSCNTASHADGNVGSRLQELP